MTTSINGVLGGLILMLLMSITLYYFVHHHEVVDISTTISPAPSIELSPSYLEMHPETWERVVEELLEKVRGGEALDAFDRAILWSLYQKILNKEGFEEVAAKLKLMIEEIWDIQATLTGEEPYRPEKEEDAEE